MKILIINYSEITAPGGIHKTIYEVSKNLSRRGHEVTILQGNQLGLPTQEKNNGFQVLRMDSSCAQNLYGFSPRAFSFLKKNLRKLNPDVVHIHDYNSLFSMEMLYLIRRLDPQVPIIFSPHLGVGSHVTRAGKYFWSYYNRFMRRTMLKIPNITIASSQYEKNNLKSRLKIAQNKIRIIPHGVNKYFSPQKKRQDGVIHLLYLGYLLDFKGVQYILEAVRDLVFKKKTRVQFTIVGEGPYEDELRSQAQELEITPQVRFEGFVDPQRVGKIKDYYQESDVFLLLSSDENYGIVVLEALSMGTPVIVTKKTALKEFLVEKGCYGVEYPPDPGEVADLIQKIYQDHVTVGPVHSKTWDLVAQDYEQLYSDLITGNSK